MHNFTFPVILDLPVSTFSHHTHNEKLHSSIFSSSTRRRLSVHTPHWEKPQEFLDNQQCLVCLHNVCTQFSARETVHVLLCMIMCIVMCVRAWDWDFCELCDRLEEMWVWDKDRVENLREHCHRGGHSAIDDLTTQEFDNRTNPVECQRCQISDILVTQLDNHTFVRSWASQCSAG